MTVDWSEQTARWTKAIDERLVGMTTSWSRATRDPMSPMLGVASTSEADTVNVFVFDDLATDPYLLQRAPAPLATYAVGGYRQPGVTPSFEFADGFTLDELPAAVAEWVETMFEWHHQMRPYGCDACGRSALVTHRAGGRGYHHDEGSFCDECAGVTR